MKNEYEIIDGIAHIRLNHGKVTQVNEADLPLVAPYRWHFALGFAHAASVGKNGKSANGSVRMHRVILGVGSGRHVMHLDGNKLNNTRANLALRSRSNDPARTVGAERQARHREKLQQLLPAPAPLPTDRKPTKLELKAHAEHEKELRRQRDLDEHTRAQGEKCAAYMSRYYPTPIFFRVPPLRRPEDPVKPLFTNSGSFVG